MKPSNSSFLFLLILFLLPSLFSSCRISENNENEERNIDKFSIIQNQDTSFFLLLDKVNGRVWKCNTNENPGCLSIKFIYNTAADKTPNSSQEYINKLKNISDEELKNRLKERFGE